MIDELQPFILTRSLYLYYNFLSIIKLAFID